MTTETIIENIVPNPLDKQSNLSGLAKKGEQLNTGMSLVKSLQVIPFLIIIPLLLIFRSNVSPILMAILFGAEILITLVTGVIQYRNFHTIAAIKTSENPVSYREILIKTEYYGLLTSVLGFLIDIIAVTIVFLFFPKELASLQQVTIPISIDLQPDQIKYSIFAFTFFRFFETSYRLVKYFFVRKIKQSSDFAEINREKVLIDDKLDGLNVIPFIAILVLVSMLFRLPFYIPLMFIVWIGVVFIAGIVQYQRVKNIKFDNKNVDTQSIRKAVPTLQNEQINGSIFGILRTATGVSDWLSLSGQSIKNSFKMIDSNPENSLLITNARLIFIQVLLPGGNKVVQNSNATATDYVQMNFFYNRAEMKQKGEELIKNNSLEQVLKFAIDAIDYNEIKSFHLNKSIITIEKTSGEKFGYVFMDPEYEALLKTSMPALLQERFTTV